jgi:hypothetical protein
MNYTLPVVSVVCDWDFLYSSEIGVMTTGPNGRPGNGQSQKCNWNMDWERPVNFSYLTADGEMVLNQDVNLEMCGGWSRAWTPHSFKLKGTKEMGGDKNLPYPFFTQKPYIRNRTLQIRNGGNDTSCRFKDASLSYLVQTSGIDVDVQGYQPVHEFINGKYIGVLNVREPNNKHYVYANYGWDDDEIDQWEMSPDSGYIQKCGTPDAYNELVDDLSPNAADPAVYQEICNVLDIDEFTNYMAIQFYYGGSDWPRNNVKSFRLRDGGKFRFVLFDVDAAFDYGTNAFDKFMEKEWWTFDELYPRGTGRITDQIRLVTLFKNLIQNDTYRKKFINTYCVVAGSVFDWDRVKETLQYLYDRVEPAMNLEGGSAYSSYNNVRNNLSGRLNNAINAMKNFSDFQLSDSKAYSVKLKSDVQGAVITVNGVALDPLQFKYTVNDPEAANKEFYEQVYIDPAEGEVESLEDFRLYFPVTVSKAYEGVVTLTNTTTGTSYELQTLDLGMKYVKYYTMEAVKEAGEYEMVVPAGAVEFYYDGKFQKNVELKYHWTIPGNVEQKYYIMGSFLDSFTWETELEMTQVNDTLLTCEYEYAVNFAEGQTSKVIEFKMRQGHDWNGFQLPAQGNEKYEFTEPGVYQLTFTADIKNYTLKCEAVKAVYTYTVAGAFLPAEEGAEEEAAFFGTMWDVENTANDLVEGDYDIYKLSFQNVDLKAGKILYKVVRNHSWDVNYGFGSENASYNVNEAARYNITFKFSPTKKVDPYEVYNLTVSLEKVERPVGDVNGDYEVGIGDIVAITNIMAENGSDAAADVNGDGEVGIGDIVAVTNIMAGVEGETEPEVTE